MSIELIEYTNVLVGLIVSLFSYFFLSNIKVHVFAFVLSGLVTYMYLKYVVYTKQQDVKFNQLQQKNIELISSNQPFVNSLVSLQAIIFEHNPTEWNAILELCTEIDTISQQRNITRTTIERMLILQEKVQNSLGSLIHTLPKLSDSTWTSFVTDVAMVEKHFSEIITFFVEKFNETSVTPYLLSTPKPNPMKTNEYSSNYSVFI